jgi:hypothetical protein
MKKMNIMEIEHPELALGVVCWMFAGAECFGASFLLSGMEAGVFALNRLRVRRLARGPAAVGANPERLPGKAGEFSVDDSGRQHAGQFSSSWAGFCEVA